MSDLGSQENKPIPRKFFEDLGFDLNEDVFSFYTKDDKIVFLLQLVEEAGCNFVIKESEEEFPLTEEQIQKLKDANYYGAEGRFIV